MGREITFRFTDAGHFVGVEHNQWDEGVDDVAPVITSKDDRYKPETLTWLLKQVGITQGNWILRKFDPGRIVAVCCWAIEKERRGEIKTSKEWFALGLFKNGYDVPDVRDKILASICAKPAPTKPAVELVAEFNEAQAADRKLASDLLQQYMFGIGKGGPGAPPGDSDASNASPASPRNSRSSKGRAGRSK